MSLGEKIQQLRKAMSLSQEQFADILKVSRQSISKWETDQSSPEIEKLLTISKFFSVSIDELLGNDVIANAETSSSKLDEVIKINMKNRQFTVGWITIIIGLFLLITEFFALKIIQYYDFQIALQAGLGWHTDIMAYAKTQPMISVFIITIIIILIGICLTLVGLIHRNEVQK